jgi:methylmalonyl-CoA mutase N-terminal domain/subunit
MRVAYQALAAVLGGCQSLHSNSMDETLALPSEHAVTLALRTQQVLAYETGVTNTPDPLGGSYFVETLTEQMRRQAEDYFEQIDQQGGMLAAVDAGFFRREIAEAAFVYQKSVDKREKIIVGVNAFEEDEHKSLDILQIDEGPEEEQLRSLARLKKTRDNRAVERTLTDVKRAAARKENVFPALMEAATARATVYETMSALADVLGRHETGGLS